MKFIRIATATLLVCFLGSCTTTTDPYTRDEKTSNTVKGAGLGAIIGGVLGAAVNKKDRGKGALIGAVAGGAIGGGVGNYMDNQEAKLRRVLDDSGVSVTRNGDVITLNMPGNITFDTDSSHVKSSFYNVLSSVALILKEFKRSDFRVAGYTDSRGSRDHNQRLSEQRADSVAGYIMQQGIDPRRVFTQGYGENQPIGDNATSHGRSMNRRVEIQILPPRG